MSESIVIAQGSKAEKYESLILQIKAIVEGEDDVIANMANISSALKMQFDWWWVGFYIVKNDQLVLGPFQGPIACTRIMHGRGVCGTAWQNQTTVLVEDVNKFAGHIACSTASLSEIVIPIFRNKEVIAVLDVDSEHLSYFDETDKQYLEEIAKLIQ